MAHLNAAGGREGLLGIVQAAIAALGGAQIHQLGFEPQAGPAGSDPVQVSAVAAADEAVQCGGRGIGEPQQLGDQPGLGLGGQSCLSKARPGLGGRQGSVAEVRAEVAKGNGAQVQGQSLGSHQIGRERFNREQGALLGCQAGADAIGQFHLIEQLVAAQAHQHRQQAAIGAAGQQQQHLDDLGGIEAMGGAQGLDAGLAGGGQVAAGLGRQGQGLWSQGHGPLLVGRVAAVAAAEDQVLAGLGGDHEFLAGGAADGAAIGLHRDGFETAATENSPVGPVHLGVALLEAGLIGVEGIAILHDEFAAAHQPEAGPDLVPEFGLNLIKIDR